MQGEEVQDIEDIFLGDISDQPRQSQKVHNVKKALKKKKEPKVKEEKEYEPNLIQHVPGTQKIYVKTFGCSHNISDSEFMMGQLSDYGYEIVENAEEADLVVVTVAQ
jgi:threonylcarbamoyladenosine tRNA methylthiotransferase CDKAL1